ncbi:acetyl-CoA synthetase [Candidatus Geothermarchaeota archaeon]|nr:MAG: acetyl-CoA synthetase [Candidatus Geothermarchaeota archaeon]
MNGDEDVTEIFKKAINEGRKWLLEPEAKYICKQYNIPVPEGMVVKNVDEAVKYAREIGYPLVLKIVSKDIIHKTDVGGVITNIVDEYSLRRAFNSIINNVRLNAPSAHIDGFLIEKMYEPSIELIVGMNRDTQFGPVVMFGVGGVFVEVYQDTSFRLAPLDRQEAIEMIREIKGFKLLTGYRGLKPVNLDIIADIIVKVGDLAVKYAVIKEIDLNPIFAYGDRAVAVDARIILA